MEQKYKLTADKISRNGVTLHRIKALRSFSDVKAGDFGGFIENESNLSHKGNCWVYNSAKVYGRATIVGDSRVTHDAEIWEDSVLQDKSVVSCNAKVHGASVVKNGSLVSDYADVQHAVIDGGSWIHDHAKVHGGAEMVKIDNCAIGGNAKIIAK